MRAIRSNWPNIRILIRADSHYCSPQVIDWCRANDVDFILGVAPTTTLRKHVADLESSTMARLEASKTNKVRRFKEFFDGAASWSRVERIIARVEVGAQGADTRFIVTNLASGKAKALYEDVYCRRGAAENHIKSWKTGSRWALFRARLTTTSNSWSWNCCAMRTGGLPSTRFPPLTGASPCFGLVTC